MSYWYGALFAVIEGYRDLDLHDDAVDGLLESPDNKTGERDPTLQQLHPVKRNPKDAVSVLPLTFPVTPGRA